MRIISKFTSVKVTISKVNNKLGKITLDQRKQIRSNTVFQSIFVLAFASLVFEIESNQSTRENMKETIAFSSGLRQLRSE